MIRKIIQIDEDKCNGCGLCAAACQEGAIAMIDGKARLIRDDYCDGLGNCLPACPAEAISFIEREAAAYDEAAVMANKQKKENAWDGAPKAGCPGTACSELAGSETACQSGQPESISIASQLRQWPVQIKLAPIQAPYFQNAHLLIAADCTAYAYGNFHQDFIRGKITLVGCPKLDSVDYSEKLTEIIRQNEIKSVTIVRMEVPCCSGLERAAVTALKESGKFIPWQVVTISINGKILNN